MYTVSVFGILLATVSFLRRWRVDITNIRFEPREETFSVRRTLSSTQSGKEGGNKKDNFSHASDDDDGDFEGERDG
jgi:hypothetical protein